MTLELEDILPYLRMGGRTPDDALAARIAEMRDNALREMRPAKTWRRIPTPRQWLETSRALSIRLEGCAEVYLACGTIGASFDAWHRRISVKSSADALIAQAVGAAAIEKVMDSIEDDIRSELAPGEALVTRYSPGYADFPLAEQRTLLGLLDSARKAGVSLTDSLLMIPSKSVSAVIGVKKGDMV